MEVEVDNEFIMKILEDEKNFEKLHDFNVGAENELVLDISNSSNESQAEVKHTERVVLQKLSLPGNVRSK